MYLIAERAKHIQRLVEKIRTEGKDKSPVPDIAISKAKVLCSGDWQIFQP